MAQQQPSRPLSATLGSQGPAESLSPGDHTIPRRPVGSPSSLRGSRQSTCIGTPGFSETNIELNPLWPKDHSTRHSSVHQDGEEDTRRLIPRDEDASSAPLRGPSGKDAAGYDSSFEQLRKPGPNDFRAAHRPRTHRSWMMHINAWSAEIAWCLTALVLLAAVAAILWYYRKKPKRQWPHVTLNTVIAFVATACRAAMVIPISECISQLKWNSFASQRRPIMDLYAFDQASRGPYGSVMLLFRTRGSLRGVILLPALVLVSGLITSPLTQATIDYPSEEIWSQSDNAKITTSTSLYSYGSEKEFEGMLKRAALQSIFTTDSEKEGFKPDPRCPASDCRWDTFKALDVCVSIKNVTDSLDYDPNVTFDEYLEANHDRNPYNVDEGVYNNSQMSITKITLGQPEPSWIHPFVISKDPVDRELLLLGRGPDIGKEGDLNFTHWIDVHDDVPNVEETFLGGLQLIFVPYNAPNFSEVRQMMGLEAAQIMWHWCIKEYKVNVQNGTPNVEVVSKTTDDKAEDSIERSSMEGRKHKTEFQVPMYGGDFLAPALYGGSSFSFGRDNEIRAVWQDMFYPISEPNQEDRRLLDYTPKLNRTAEAIAVAMGNALRTHHDSEDGENLRNEVLRGEALAETLILDVRWWFLCLLATQVLFTVIFLGYVIVNTAQLDVEIVKSSNMAELLALSRLRNESDEDASASGLARPHWLPVGIHEELHQDIYGELEQSDGDWELRMHRKDWVA